VWNRRAVVAAAWFERIGPGDAQALATDVGPVPANVGAVLLLDGVDPATLAATLAGRMAGVFRMRQRLQRAPLGGGRPVWVDDPDFDTRRHLDVVACAAPGDESALMATAVQAVITPLDRARPLWLARIITGLADDRVGLVLVLHHVLADGLGGLAVLAELVDRQEVGSPSPWPPAPRPAPTPSTLRADAARARRESLRRAPQALAALGPALSELGRQRPGRAPQCSLNAPTGPRRRVAGVSVELEPLRRAARDRGATVNDVLLVAAARALGAVLAARGEHLPELVISVPVSARADTTTEQLGNQVGVMPVRVPVGGSRDAVLAQVARGTTARKTTQRGASAALITPAFRLLAALGLFRPMIDRQRLVNSFLTNLRGPGQPIRLAGADIRRIAPVAMATGNVSVAFAALSYAGTLTISIIVDPDLAPEIDDVAQALRRELDGLAQSSSSR
jgi:diacylglycerol O-acyltransferase / wax synthase